MTNGDDRTERRLEESRKAAGTCAFHADLVDGILSAKDYAKKASEGTASILTKMEKNGNGKDHFTLTTPLGKLDASGAGAMNTALRVVVVAAIAWIIWDRWQEKRSDKAKLEPDPAIGLVARVRSNGG